MLKRATFENPSHYCSFNSLTQCLYHLAKFRQAFLNYNISDSKDYNNIILDGIPQKLCTIISTRSTMINFIQKYQNIFQQMDNSEILDLSECVHTFVNNFGLII